MQLRTVIGGTTAMPYSNFTTIGKVKQAFNLTTQEGIRFLPEINPLEFRLRRSNSAPLSGSQGLIA